jgi:hypothetical protein
MLDVVDIGRRDDVVDAIITEPALSLPAFAIANSTDERMLVGGIADEAAERCGP